MDNKDSVQQVSDGNKDFFFGGGVGWIGLGAIHVTILLRTFKHFTWVLRLGRGLSLNVEDKLTQWWKFEGPSASRLWHSYHQLLVARFIVRLKRKKLNRKS